MQMTEQPQPQRALAEANRVYQRRGKERRRISALAPRDGRREVAYLLLDPPEWLEGLAIGKLLKWPHKMPAPSVRKMLREARFANWDSTSELLLVREVTPRQRRALAMALGVTDDGEA